ncbi:hypothetical protein QBC35DRAFT_496947 [Podospora australis]|uniref:Translation initiation factor IF-3 n=1 Tax=Podospora australis TaxID=1536484 RepID=A0AAN6WU54_9PEZI|nr:hypothetical protein QBC35DRAFT_496947 [Podospora australis]
MNSSSCVFSSAAAIRRVFLSNGVATEACVNLQRMLMPAITVAKSRATRFTTPTPHRYFSTQPALQMQYKKKRSEEEPKNTKKVIADHEIKFPTIQIRNAEGRLSEPRRTKDVLRDLDPAIDTLILVAVPAQDEEEGSAPRYPICRIANRRAEQAIIDRNRALEKASKVVSKELEFNWAIAPHDLKFKASRLKGFLEKGYRVDVSLRHPKQKSKRKGTKEEAQEVFKAVSEIIKEVPGVSHYKPNDGAVGATLMMYLQGPAVKASQATSAAGAAPAQDAAASA